MTSALPIADDVDPLVPLSAQLDAIPRSLPFAIDASFIGMTARLPKLLLPDPRYSTWIRLVHDDQYQSSNVLSLGCSSRGNKVESGFAIVIPTHVRCRNSLSIDSSSISRRHDSFSRVHSYENSL